MRKGPTPLPAAELVRRGTAQPVRVRQRPVRRRQPQMNPSGARDYIAVADQYAADVLSGAIVACRWTRLACERFRRMRESTPAPPKFTFSPAHVVDVCSFVERLPHVEGRWSSETIHLEPWQVFALAAMFGFRRPDGGRLVTTTFIETGRKSAKSTLCAACALYHLLREKEPGAQVIFGASTASQARIAFSIAQRMVRRAAWLREEGVTAFANAVWTIDSTMKPIAAKSSTQDGLNPSFIVLDESHSQPFDLHDVLKSAQGSRDNPMLMAPTTAGYDLTSVGYALRAQAMKVLEGILTLDHYFAVLYELDEGDVWSDESVWQKANPMLGLTPKLDYLRRYRDEALATPGLQSEFEVKVCSKWLHAANRWLSIDAWQRCADTTLTLADFEHEECVIGVDLAERDDIASVVLLFQRDGLLYVFARGYLPAQVVRDRARTIPAYQVWLDTGELTATPGNLTDYPTIEADLRADCDRFDVKAIVIERFGALQLAATLAASGLPATIETKNAKTFTVPSRELEARLKAQQVRHTGSSFLTWQVSNVCVDRRRDGSLLPCKESPMSPHKIDAVDALLLALGALLAAPTVTQPAPNLFFLEA